MRRPGKLLSPPPTGPFGPPSDAPPARALVAEIKSGWLRGEPADAREVLARYPELNSDKSMVLDLAYEEYCLRQEAGAPPDPEEFCGRFPHYKTSLRRLIEAHRVLGESAADRTLSWPEAGDSFLGYALRHELGRGAFARVFLANDTELGGKWVAIKVSRHGADEAGTLGRLDGHPNVVPVLSVKKEEMSGWTAVAMPYLGGATLCDVLDRAFAGPGLPRSARVILEAARVNPRPDDPDVAFPPSHRLLRRGTYVDGVLHLAVQMADALSFVHRRGVFHSDLKPSNVLVTPDGRPMLVDFNLAFDGRQAGQKLGGTLPYMAPEQLAAAGTESGTAGLLDARSDLFAFGVILYELLTGEHPFGEVGPSGVFPEVRDAILEKQRRGPRPVRELNPLVGGDIARVVEQCLTFDPAERPESAGQIAVKLRRTLSMPRRVSRWVRHYPRRAGMIASLVLVLFGLAVLGAGAMAWKSYEDRRQFDYARQAYQSRDYAGAIGHLERWLKTNPDDIAALFMCGKSHQQLRQMAAAQKYFTAAAGLKTDDGRIDAYCGYCANYMGNHALAANSYREAIRHGFATPEVYNNLGFSLSRVKRFTEAAEWLDKALAAAPEMRAARYNRAILVLREGGDNQTREKILSGVENIRQAALSGPPSSYIYHQAAILHALAAGFEPRFNEEVWTYLGKAVKAGEKPERLKDDAFLAAFTQSPRFEQVLRLTPESTPDTVDPGLLFPVPEEFVLTR